jgi:hypothetical protein
MRVFAALLLVLSVVASATATAQEVHLDLGMDVGYLMAGDSAIRGGTANPTGGATLMPFIRVSVAVPRVAWLDVTYTQGPMLVTPFWVDRLGLVDANDFGVALHPESRAWAVGVAGTVAPTYMRFCNVLWCLKEWTLLWGVEVHWASAIAVESDGRGLSVDISARTLYAQPMAWTWPSLTPEQRAIIPVIAMLTGGAEWIF